MVLSTGKSDRSTGGLDGSQFRKLLMFEQREDSAQLQLHGVD